MTPTNKSSRREFLRNTFMTGGGLMLGFSLFDAQAKAPVIVNRVVTGSLEFNSYL